MEALPKSLPVFGGYTVDLRLQEFRRVDFDQGVIEFIPFDSKLGKPLLEAWLNDLGTDSV